MCACWWRTVYYTLDIRVLEVRGAGARQGICRLTCTSLLMLHKRHARSMMMRRLRLRTLLRERHGYCTSKGVTGLRARCARSTDKGTRTSHHSLWNASAELYRRYCYMYRIVHSISIAQHCAKEVTLELELERYTYTRPMQHRKRSTSAATTESHRKIRKNHELGEPCNCRLD